MLVRDDLNTPPMLWQEATQSPAADPFHNNAAHPGAQIGDALEVLRVMISPPYDMIPFYRPLQLARDAAFEQQVMDTIVAFDGIAFPTELEMIEHGAEGRYLGIDSG